MRRKQPDLKLNGSQSQSSTVIRAPAEFKQKERAGTHVDSFSVLFSTTRGRAEVLDGGGPLRITVEKFQKYVSSFVHLYRV